LIDVGVEYQMPNSFLPSGETYFSLDYMAASWNGEKGSNFPFAINERFYSHGYYGHRSYIYLGIGIDFMDVTSSNTVIAARGGLGEELGERIFTEVGANVGDKRDGVAPDAITASLGYRF
jgi:hypothetical protein